MQTYHVLLTCTNHELPLVGRIRRSIDDKYGCWCGFILLGKDNRKIVVLTAYNVPQETPADNDTIHAQQISLYLLDGEVDPNPRKIFIRDLLKVIKAATRENQDIILMGDFNESIREDPKMMARVIAAGRLIDIDAHKHGHGKHIASYIQGKQSVDYCFVSPWIINHVIRCGFEAFYSRLQCDHRGCFVDLSMQGLFDRQLPPIVNPTERCIRSSHPRLVRKYIDKLSAYFEDHGILKKAREAQNYYKYKEVEKLDELITAGMLHAERECRNDLQLLWSKEIHECMTQVHILRIHLSSL